MESWLVFHECSSTRAANRLQSCSGRDLHGGNAAFTAGEGMRERDGFYVLLLIGVGAKCTADGARLAETGEQTRDR